MVQGGPRKVQGPDLLGKLALILLFFSFAFGELVDRVVANVNGEPILESELKIAQIFYGVGDRERVLKELIDKHLIAQFLEAQGVKVPESYLNTVLSNIAKTGGKTLGQLYEELYREGLTPEDLRNFLRVEIASTVAFSEFMKGKLRVSEVEIELERLKRGEVKYLREIDLVVVSKEKKEELLRALSEVGPNIESLAKKLGIKVERLKVEKGELVEPLDEEVWRGGVGQMVVAEDEENIYLAEVVREVRLYSGRSEEEIREEILRRKIRRERERILEKLKREALIEILYPREAFASSPP